MSIISETWVDFRDSIYFNGFDVIRKDRLGRGGGGVLILVRSSLKYVSIDFIPDCHGNIEICGIELFSSEGKITIISLCRPPNSPHINPRVWSNFFSHFTGNVIIGGDFNLPQDKHNFLLEGIADLDFILLNDDSNILECRERFLLLFRSHINTSLGMNSWSIINDLWGSDHFSIANPN